MYPLQGFPLFKDLLNRTDLSWMLFNMRCGMAKKTDPREESVKRLKNSYDLILR